MNKKDVSVFVITYNHKNYVAQAIESILMQEVSFSYEMIIHDDASTDGTTEIIKLYETRYPDIIKTRCQKENQYSQGKLTVGWDCMQEMCTGKYCAFLEGDDYWSDKEKLQRQYDYMESHPECSLYIHNAVRLDVRNGEEVLLNTFPKSGYYSQREQVLCGLGSKFPAFGSYFFIMDDLRSNVPEFILKAGVGDYPYRQVLANKGEVYYDERPMSVYRYMTSGSFMKNLRDDPNAYVTYISRITSFYEQFDQYTDYRFHDVYSKKIDSDILGLAAVTYAHRDLLEKTGHIEMFEKLNKYYELLSDTKWFDDLKKQIDSQEAVWVYGTSALAAICKKSLEQAGIGVKGFVVSDGYSKVDVYEGCVVKYISETKGNNDFYVIAAQPINADSIERVLVANNVSRYYCPYAAEKR